MTIDETKIGFYILFLILVGVVIVITATDAFDDQGECLKRTDSFSDKVYFMVREPGSTSFTEKSYCIKVI